jgi:tRNA(fMet)-specific endonuclease VapC
MKYLLDTNARIRLMMGDGNVRRNLSSKAPDDCAISMVTVFELFSGVEKCADSRKEALKVRRLLDAFHLLPFDWDSALHTVKIRGHLEKIGKIIGPYDLQLAGQSLALELILVTHNTREFSRGPGLSIENWQIA